MYITVSGRFTTSTSLRLTCRVIDPAISATVYWRVSRKRYTYDYNDTTDLVHNSTQSVSGAATLIKTVTGLNELESYFITAYVGAGVDPFGSVRYLVHPVKIGTTRAADITVSKDGSLELISSKKVLQLVPHYDYFVMDKSKLFLAEEYDLVSVHE